MGLFETFGKLYGKKKAKPKLFEKTFAGRHLKKISEEGKFDPGVRQGILNLMGVRAGGEISKRTAATRGYLTSRGMGGGTIAGARLMDRPRRELQQQLTERGAELDIENEMSKLEAEYKLRTGKDASREQKRQWRAEFYRDVGAGVEDIGRDVGMAYMTGGTSEILPGMMMGGENLMNLRRYQEQEKMLDLLRKKYGNEDEQIMDYPIL